MKHKTAISIGYVLLMVLFGVLPTVNAALGDLDSTFSGDGKLIQGIGVGGYDFVRATRIQADGKIIVAGETTAGGRYLFGIARYNADGSLDTTFGDGGRKKFSINAVSGCDAIAIQPDGKIVMVGYSKRGTTNYDFAVARLNADGSLDTTFDSDGMLTTDINLEDAANGVAIQADGKIVVTGYSGTDTRPDFAVVRYNSDGSLDTSFDGDGKVTTPIGTFADRSYDVAIQTDGKIVVAGYSDGSIANMVLVRYNTNGSLDTGFGSHGKVLINVLTATSASAVVIQPDGKIVVAGEARSSSDFNFVLVRLNTDGSLDTTFDGDGIVATSSGVNFSSISSAAIQADGKIMMAGYLTNGTNNDTILFRYNSDGSPDTSFDGDGKVITNITGTNDEAYGIAIQTDGKIIAAGGIDSDISALSEYDFFIIRYDANGSLDTSFNSLGYAILNVGNKGSYARAVATQADGKIIAAGSAAVISNRNGFALIRLNPDGTLDTSFDGDGVVTTAVLDFSSAYAVAVQPDGKIIAAGSAAFTSSSNSDFALVRYNTDGSVDTTFGLGGRAGMDISGFSDVISDIEILPDGKILVGGTANLDPGGIPTRDFALARFNSDGSVDTTFRGGGKFNFGIGQADILAELVIQPDGKFIAVGSYQNNNGNSQFALVRFFANGETDGFFGTGGIVTTGIDNSRDVGEAVALQADGKIVVAGYTYGGSASNIELVRYHPNGSLDTSFDGDGKVTTDLGSYETASSVAIQTDGKILLGGTGRPGNEFSNDLLLVRYNTNGSLDTSYGTGGYRTIDMLGGTSDSSYGMILDSIGRAVVVGEAGGSFAIARILGDSAAPHAAPFDFDGDGKSDISIFRPSLGEWWYLRSSDGGNRAFGFGNSADKLIPGDYTGDGKTDIAVWRPVSGEWFILRSEDVSYYSFPFGTSGDVPVPFDFDGDNKADAGVFRPSNNTWYINKSTGGTQITIFGASGDVPAVGDYDGDGRADIAVYRPALGEWWINRSSDNGVYVITFGTNTDKPVQGDYTGDGKTDVAIWRGSTGEWLILRSENNSYYSVPFGISTDIPVAGDYDGDGKFDIAVFRPSSSTWYINRSTAGILITDFGISGDKPVPSVFVP